ncbi:hypothetical protein [Nocardioides alcanivorans]|uniref:hypothetical protein n=1 Tax=Nocardioides alcanivorans TaxID=2897352 RepID=UPI001F25A091|nr:hypothetical protein [Nocardioides alcanivorans]
MVTGRGEVSRNVHDLVTDARQLVLWQRDRERLEAVAAADRGIAQASVAAARAVATARAVAGTVAVIGVVGTAALLAGPLAGGELRAPMAALALLLPSRWPMSSRRWQMLAPSPPGSAPPAHGSTPWPRPPPR